MVPKLHDILLPMLFLAGVFFFVCGLTWAIRKFTLRHSLLDIPNQRSSHSIPTPHGGGLALLLGFYLGGGYLVLTGRVVFPTSWG